MKTQNVVIQLRDGKMGGYLAIPDTPPAGAIIAIMEIWGVNDTMRQHAHEFAEAGYVCLVPDLFWRQEPGVELSDRNPAHVEKAFDLYYGFDYDLGVSDMQDCERWLKFPALPLLKLHLLILDSDWRHGSMHHRACTKMSSARDA